MIEYEKFIYLDMYKTGSTYIDSLLKRLVEGQPVRRTRHAPITKGRPFFWKQGKYAFATVRNPWDWYVSMWAYSIKQPNVLFFRDVRKVLGPEGSKKLFDAENPKESFATWLRALADPKFLNSVMIGHPYSKTSLMRVTTPHPALAMGWWNIRNMDQAIAHQKRWALYDKAFKSETLTEDFSAFVLENKDKLGFKKNARRILEKNAPVQKNTSNRTLSTYRDYYTDELRQLVATRDRLVIELFGYEF